MSKIDPDCKAWWVVGILGAIATWYYISAWRTEKLWNRTRFWIVIIPSALYVLCRCSPKWDFVPICGWLCFTDLFLLITFTELLLLRRRRSKAEPKYKGLVYCTPKDAPDTYGRGDYLASLSAEIVKSFPHDQSFATGITGEWGTGKSWFLESLERKIVNKDSSVVVIKFAPWSCNTPSEIISEFFELYKREISVIVPSISSNIDRYVDALLDVADNGVAKFIKALYHPNGRGQSYNYDKIKACLTKAQLKVLVVVDDLDRLHGPEIMEVLTLIRNTANFPYTHFLVAYDKGYVTHAMTEAKVDRPEQYLEKIFNFEVPLPKFEPKAICMELHKEIGSILQEQIKEDKKIKEIIYDGITEGANERTTLLIPQILQTKRDVIRFSNSLKVNWKACTTKEMCVKDFFYLELIRYGFPKIYTTLRDNPLELLRIEGSYYCAKEQLSHIHSEYMEGYIKQGEQESKNRPTATQGLPKQETLPRKTREDKISLQIEFLSPYIDQIYYRKCIQVVSILHNLFYVPAKEILNFSNISSNFKYFAYRADTMAISQAEMVSAIVNNIIPDKWKNEDNVHTNEVLDNLTKILRDATDDFQDFTGNSQDLFREQILTFLSTTLTRYSNALREEKNFSRVQHEPFSALFRLLHKSQTHCLKSPVYFMKLQIELLNHINRVTSDYVLVFNDIMAPSKQEPYLNIHEATAKEIKDIKDLLKGAPCPEIIAGLLTSLIKNHSKRLIIPPDELKEIQMHYLRKHVKTETEVSPNTMTLLYALKKSVPPATEFVQLEPEALKLVHDFIIAHPEGYIDLFYRNAVHSNSPDIGRLASESLYFELFESNNQFETFIMQEAFNNFNKIKLVRNFWELFKANEYQTIDISGRGDIKDLEVKSFQPLMDQLVELQRIDAEVNQLISISQSDKDILNERIRQINLFLRYTGDLTRKIKELPVTYS